MENYKKIDKENIISFITSKGETEVQDILDNSGAHPFRVYPIIAELQEEGKLEILKYADLGAPLSVRMK